MSVLAPVRASRPTSASARPDCLRRRRTRRPVPTSLRSSYRNPVGMWAVGLAALALSVCAGATIAAGVVASTEDPSDTRVGASALAVVLSSLCVVLVWALARTLVGMRHELRIDADGIARAGAVGWEAPWDDIAHVEIERRSPQYHLVVVEKDRAQHRRRGWMLAGELWLPDKSLSVLLDPSDIGTVVEICKAHEIRIAGAARRR